MEESIVGRRSCVVELKSIWTSVEAYIESVRLVSVAELRQLVRWEVIIVWTHTQTQATIFDISNDLNM